MKHLLTLSLAATLTLPLFSENFLPQNPHEYGRSNVTIQKYGSIQLNSKKGAWCALQKKVALKKGYYRISFDHNAPAGVVMKINASLTSKKDFGREYADLAADGSNHTLAGYIFLPEDDTLKINIFADGNGNIDVRNIRLEPFAAGDLTLEISDKASPFWGPQWAYRNTKYKFGYVDADDHIDGGKALRIRPEGGKAAIFQSFHFPVLPGKNYEMTFWLKASADVRAVLHVDGWVNGEGVRHWYKTAGVRLGKEWQEFKLAFTSPEDNCYRGMMCLKIALPDGAEFVDLKQCELKEVK